MIIKMSTISKKNGIALVETLLSIFILVTVLSLVLVTFIVGRMGVVRAKHRIEARNFLRAEMEMLKNTTYKDIESEGPDIITINLGPDLIEDTEDDFIGERIISVTDINGYKEITISFYWKERGWRKGTIKVHEKLTTYINIWNIYQ